MNLKDKLTKLRKDNNLTQDELAEKLYISRQTISNWENGRTYPDIETLILISNKFNISLDDLLKTDKEVIKDIDKKIKSHKKLKIIITVLIITFSASMFIGYLYHNNHKIITRVIVKNIPEDHMIWSTRDNKILNRDYETLKYYEGKYVNIYIDENETPIASNAQVFDYGYGSMSFVVSNEEYLELSKYNISDVNFIIKIVEQNKF
ncbi:MAG: helix-turn-helix transcriptional regulator [Bacilli bacterium]|nr:helix-turn-helix transcriptional regulator [Bacilli bacterium]